MINFLQRFFTVVVILFLVIRISFSQEPVIVQVYYSGYADECSWEIINNLDNSVVLSGGPGPSGVGPYFSYDQTINFIPGEYTFIAYDSYGDGWPSPGAWYLVSPSTGIGTGTLNFVNGDSQETPFSVFSTENVDLGLISWDTPVSSPGMGASENVTVRIRNYGIDTINSLNLSYSINAGFSYVTEQYSDSVFPGDTLLYTFSQTANFTAPGTYSCIAYVSSVGDVMTANDTVSVSINSFASINSFPWQETFSVWPPQGWSFSGSESWLSYANTSAFCNFFYWNQGAAEMISPPLNIYSPATLSFDWSSTFEGYSLNDEMQLFISTDYGSTWDLLLEKSGIYLNSYDGATSQSPGTFINEQIDLTSYSNEIIYLKFKGASDLGPNLYVDNVTVNLNPQNDMAVIDWVYPPEAGCDLGQSENIIVKVKNTGSSIISSFNLAYSLSGGASYTFETVNLPVNVNPGDTVEYIFATPANFSTYGTYNCKALVISPGDMVLSNDMFTTTVKSLNTINTFPFNEDFESGDSDYFIANANSYANAGIYSEGSNYSIKMEGGPAGYGWIGTPSGTLPNEAWNINLSHQSSLFACTVDATNLSTLELLFDLKQFYKYGPAYSYFRVMINGQQMPDENGILNFHPQTELSDPYSTIRFDLSMFAGTQFDLQFESSNKLSSFTHPPGNVAFIDNVIIREIPPPDAAIVGINSPVSTCNLTSSEILEVQVQNNGGEEISSFDLSYSINGGAYILNTVNVAIQPGSVLNYSFPQIIDLSIIGQYIINVAVDLPGDMISVNDTVAFLVENMSQMPITFSGLLPVYCNYDPSSVLTGDPVGGIFSGLGVVGNVFDPTLAGPGIHDITYSLYNQASGCNSSVIQSVVVNGYEVSFTGLYTGPVLVPVLVEVFYNSGWVTEQSWEILDEAGNIVLSYPPVSSNGYSYNGIINLQFGNYVFVAHDSYGDGWNDSWYNIAPDFGVGTGVQFYDIPSSQQPVNQQISEFTVGGQSFMCYGDPAVTLTGSPIGGIFTGPGINGNIFDPTIAGIGIHNIAYTYTDGTGCTGIDVQIMIVEELPVVNLGQDIVACEGTSVSLDAGSAYSYLWNDGSTDQLLDVYSTDLFSVTISTEMGCEGSDQINVLIHPTPPVDFGADLDLCLGDTAILDAGIGSTYLWNDGSTLNTLEVLITGNYSATVTSPEGCLGSDEIQITFHEVNVDLGTNQYICVGDTFILDAGSFFSYNWSTGSTDQTIEVFTSNQYTITVTDIYGCEDIDLFSLYVNPIPQVDLGPDFIIEDTVIFLEPGIFSSYLWSDGSNSMLYPVNGNTLPPGPNLIWVEVTNAFGCYNRDSIIIQPSQTEQIIELIEGWSIISTYIYPYNASIDTVFSAVAGSTILVKNSWGTVFWPSFNVNLIGNMVIGEGYQVNMASLQYLTVFGEQAVPEATGINISSGWGIIGYLRTTPASIDTMLASIVSDILLVKNGDGDVYWPIFLFNGIGDMLPGSGYQINMANQATFYYPANGGSTLSGLKSKRDCQYFSNNINTGHNMTLCIPINAWDLKPEYGDEIGVFSESGIFVGSTVYESDNCIITIWGDDPYSPQLNGLLEGEAFTLKLWSERNGTVSELETFDFVQGSELYFNNEISVAEKVFSVSSGNYYLGQNYPNPFTKTSTIDFYLPEETDVTISIYSSLGRYLGTICNKNYPVGSHSVELSGDFAAGIYYYEFITNKFKAVKQFSVLVKK